VDNLVNEPGVTGHKWKLMMSPASRNPWRGFSLATGSDQHSAFYFCNAGDFHVERPVPSGNEDQITGPAGLTESPAWWCPSPSAAHPRAVTMAMEASGATERAGSLNSGTTSAPQSPLVGPNHPAVSPRCIRYIYARRERNLTMAIRVIRMKMASTEACVTVKGASVCIGANTLRAETFMKLCTTKMKIR
jgi:hypothetical protein